MFLFNYENPNLIKNDKVSAPTPKQPQFYFSTWMTSPWRDLKINLDSEIPNESEKIADWKNRRKSFSVRRILKTKASGSTNWFFQPKKLCYRPENTERTMMFPLIEHLSWRTLLRSSLNGESFLFRRKIPLATNNATRNVNWVCESETEERDFGPKSIEDERKQR